MAEGAEEIEVTILSRTTITVYPRLREAKEVVMVTYTAPGIPPRTLNIPKEEWTAEHELELIKEDIKAYRARRPEVKRIKLT